MPAMRHVKTLKGLLNPELIALVSSHVAFGRYGCARRMLQASKSQGPDPARADLFQTAKLQP